MKKSPTKDALINEHPALNFPRDEPKVHTPAAYKVRTQVPRFFGHGRLPTPVHDGYDGDMMPMRPEHREMNPSLSLRSCPLPHSRRSRRHLRQYANNLMSLVVFPSTLSLSSVQDGKASITATAATANRKVG